MSKKTSYEDVKLIVEKEGDKLISNTYEGNKKLLKIECSCGRAGFYRSLASIKQHNAYHCDICKNELLSKKKKSRKVNNRRMSYEEVVEYVESKGCKFISNEYNKADDIYEFECSCGRPFKRSFSKFKNSNQTRCLECSKESMKNILKHDYEYVKEFIESKGCKLLSNEYINNEMDLKIECKCGNEFNRNFTHFKDEHSYFCRRCLGLTSNSENYIMDFLDDNNVKYINEFTFDNCKLNRSLPFDFYLPDYNIIIEYDGKQHYKYGCFNGNLLDLMNIKYRDNIKTQYCKDNNIKLIRIPYWERDNIEKILIYELNLNN